MRGGRIKPWSKADLPRAWVEAYYNGMSCTLVALLGQEESEEVFCARVIHFIHSHRWHKFSDIVKELKTGGKRVKDLMDKYHFAC
jgi:hypothetical protein